MMDDLSDGVSIPRLIRAPPNALLIDRIKILMANAAAQHPRGKSPDLLLLGYDNAERLLKELYTYEGMLMRNTHGSIDEFRGMTVYTDRRPGRGDWLSVGYEIKEHK